MYVKVASIINEDVMIKHKIITVYHIGPYSTRYSRIKFQSITTKLTKFTL